MFSAGRDTNWPRIIPNRSSRVQQAPTTRATHEGIGAHRPPNTPRPRAGRPNPNRESKISSDIRGGKQEHEYEHEHRKEGKGEGGRCASTAP